ncbi:MAG: hypothetical protein V1876_03095, partial [Candidatus Peregrinibacteria bacterium]
VMTELGFKKEWKAIFFPAGVSNDRLHFRNPVCWEAVTKEALLSPDELKTPTEDVTADDGE